MAFVSTAERVKQENLNLVCIPTSFQVCPAFHSASWHLAAEFLGPEDMEVWLWVMYQGCCVGGGARSRRGVYFLRIAP